MIQYKKKGTSSRQMEGGNKDEMQRIQLESIDSNVSVSSVSHSSDLMDIN
jgi:hypothetical protein